MLNPEEIIIWFVVFLLSLTVHECAHAWVAELSGDPTARYQGRVTLNPIPHIDIFGTVIFPLVAIVSGAFMFGWAKPVPTNPINLRDRRWGEIMIALAGPLSNVLLVIIFVVLYKLIFGSLAMPSARLGDLGVPVEQLLLIGIRLNIVLAVFNMIPIPPLDGSHVLRNLLPDSLAEMYNQIPDMIGFVLLMGLIYFGITATLTAPIDHLIRGILVL
ncbi:MAG TPA: site-2 protease family protein [Blastocatellia bacterium]|nr:site-2 protease family protein [Blastocatellia bacterium]